MGEIIEVAFVPARVDLEFTRIKEECESGKLGDYEGFNSMLDIILPICKSNPTITKDWLLDNTSIDMILEFFITAKGKAPRNNEKNDTASGKN